jgi:hypothetical protein
MAMETHETMQKRIRINLNHLNKKQSRIYLASEAMSYGWGGITLTSQLSGASHKTIQLGSKELKEEIERASADKTDARAQAANRKKTNSRDWKKSCWKKDLKCRTNGDDKY